MPRSAPPIDRMVCVTLRRCPHCKGTAPFVDSVCFQCLKDGCDECTEEIRTFSRYATSAEG